MLKIELMKPIYWIVCLVLVQTTAWAQLKVEGRPDSAYQLPTITAENHPLLAAFDNSERQPRWLAGTIDIDFQSPDLSISAKADVRFRRDSVIWLNIKKLGFAVMRVKITQDSIWVINYLEDSYMALGMAALEQRLGFPFGFSALQDIILGNPIFMTEKAALKEVLNDNTNWHLAALNADVAVDYIGSKRDTLLLKQTVQGMRQPGKIALSLDNYDALPTLGNKARLFAYTRRIVAESPEMGSLSIDLEVDKEGLEVNIPKNIRFEIPSGYKKREQP